MWPTLSNQKAGRKRELYLPAEDVAGSGEVAVLTELLPAILTCVDGHPEARELVSRTIGRVVPRSMFFHRE